MCVCVQGGGPYKNITQGMRQAKVMVACVSEEVSVVLYLLFTSIDVKFGLPSPGRARRHSAAQHLFFDCHVFVFVFVKILIRILTSHNIFCCLEFFYMRKMHATHGTSVFRFRFCLLPIHFLVVVYLRFWTEQRR